MIDADISLTIYYKDEKALRYVNAGDGIYFIESQLLVEDLLTACEKLGLSKSTLWELLRTDRLKLFVDPRKATFYVNDVNDLGDNYYRCIILPHWGESYDTEW